MKRIKFADMRNKNVISKKEFSYKDVKTEEFDGYISLLKIKETEEEWFVPRKNGKKDCILKKGYKWLSLFPRNKKYALTLIYTDENKMVEVYCDMTKGAGIEENVPYIEDLYLDIVFTDEMEEYVLDEDELEEALNTNKITKEDFEMAYETLDLVKEKYRNKENFENLLKFSDTYLKLLEEKN